MRSGYILLHRQGLTPDEWRHPLRTLAWIDFLTMAAWDDYTAEDGVHFKRGEVVASYGFLAKRWGLSKGNVHLWISHWIAERQVERCTERCTERNAERFFIVNYAKYQDTTEWVAERSTERVAERSTEQMKRKELKTNKEIKIKQPSATQKGPRPSVEFVMKTMKECFGPLDGSEKDNRRYAWLLIQQAMKNRPGSTEDEAAAGCVALIRAAQQHSWWATRITRVQDIFKNSHKIINALRSDKKRVLIAD